MKTLAACLVAGAVATSASAQLKITEIMYNPFATNEFEWVEVYNAGGADVDISGWVFARDLNQNPDLGGNVGSGVVPAGGTAVLIRTDGTPEVPRGGRLPAGYEVAWELPNNPVINFINVNRWPGLTNDTSGTGLGLWSSVAGYLQDVITTFQDPSNPVFTYTNAVYNMSYANGVADWPVTDVSNINDGPSIYLRDVTADENVGLNWALSVAGVDNAYNGGSGSITVATGSQSINRTNDVGSPGLLPPAGLAGDFNDDGARDALDIDLLLRAVPGAIPPAEAKFDLTGDGLVTPAPNAADSDADEWVRGLAGTEYGDANLDGRVDVTDLGIVASNWQSAGAGWAGADFDGDDLTAVGDLGLLATYWQSGVVGPSAPGASFEQAWRAAGAGALVPEPAGLITLAPLWRLMGRTRREKC